VLALAKKVEKVFKPELTVQRALRAGNNGGAPDREPCLHQAD